MLFPLTMVLAAKLSTASVGVVVVFAAVARTSTDKVSGAEGYAAIAGTKAAVNALAVPPATALLFDAFCNRSGVGSKAHLVTSAGVAVLAATREI